MNLLKLHIIKDSNILYLFIGLSPLYLWRSGTPQIADILIAIFLGYSLIRYRSHLSKLDLLFLLYVFSVNAVTIILNIGDNKSHFTDFLFTLYFVFNISLFRLISKMRISREKVINVLFLGVIAQLLKIGFNGGEAVRMTAFFNNSNQLGTWALLSLIMLPILYDKSRSGKVVFTALGCVTLVFASGSKGAMLGVLIFTAFIIVRGRLLNYWNVFLAVVSFGLIFYVFEDFFLDGYNRLIGDWQADDSLEGRGYDRILHFPEYMLFGAGEGYFYRFDSNIEIHSSIGTLLFSYGIIGSLLFFFSLFRDTNLGGVRTLFPLIMIHLSHNGLRFTYMWVVLGIIAAINEKINNNRSIPKGHSN